MRCEAPTCEDGDACLRSTWRLPSPASLSPDAVLSREHAVRRYRLCCGRRFQSCAVMPVGWSSADAAAARLQFDAVRPPSTVVYVCFSSLFRRDRRIDRNRRAGLADSMIDGIGIEVRAASP